MAGAGITIGVLGSQDPEKGGVYQYSLTVVRALASAPACADRHVIFAGPRYPGLEDLLACGWRREDPPIRIPPWAGVRRYGRPGAVAARAAELLEATAARRFGIVRPARRDPSLERRLRTAGVDLMVYPVPTPIAAEAGVPYVMAIHDLQHRLRPNVREVSTPAVWLEREYRYRRGAPGAAIVLADSKEGKEDILRFYGRHGIEAEAIRVLPFVPPPYLTSAATTVHPDEAARRLGLPPRFFFYPASTWPSKNHVRLVRALGEVRRRGHDVHLVLCGATRGRLRQQTLTELHTTADEEGIGDRVHHLGFVPDEEISLLYTRAAALTMPTLLGPTNIPVVEAWSLGCPVITSDLRGIREHAGEAAVVVDPYDTLSIANGMERILTEPALTERLKVEGMRRLHSYSFEDFRERLLEAIEAAKTRLAAVP